MRKAAALSLAAAWTLVLACAPKGDPVRASLDSIVKAANARDAERLFEHVSSTFQAADGSGLADAKAMVDRYFAAYEILAVTIRDVQIERGEGAARVRLRAEMSGQPRKVGGLSGLVPTASTYDFDLRMTLEDGQWKVAWAQWTVASLAAAPAARGVLRCARGDERRAARDVAYWRGSALPPSVGRRSLLLRVCLRWPGRWSAASRRERYGTWGSGLHFSEFRGGRTP